MIFLVVYFLLAYLLAVPVYRRLRDFTTDEETAIVLSYIVAGAWPIAVMIFCYFLIRYLLGYK